jgi:hypothetical protein
MAPGAAMAQYAAGGGIDFGLSSIAIGDNTGAPPGAFGIGHTSASGDLRYNIAASFVSPSDHADVGVVAGVSYTFGH